MSDPLTKENIKFYTPKWGTNEWVMCSTESLSQYIDRVESMNQRLSVQQIEPEEINNVNHDEIRVLSMEFYGDEFSRNDVITLQREDHNNVDIDAIMVYQERKGYKIHVSYVCKEDSNRIRYTPGFERKTLKLVGSYGNWSKFKFQN